MFGNNNKQVHAMKKDAIGQPDINMISKSTKITGALETKTDLRISGTIDGQVYAESKCFISETGLVKGDMKSKEADIAGTVEGELMVSNRLILRSTAKISGDIITKVLMVEEGARIDGACKMGDQIDLSGSAKQQNGTSAKSSSGGSSDKNTVSVSGGN